MKISGKRRGVRALALVASMVGAITVGIATQASAGVLPPPNPPALIGTGSAQNSTNKSVTASLTLTPDAGSVIVVSVATGTFQGPVGCTDNTNGTSASTNVYDVVADKNTGSGRLFVCVSKLNVGYNTSIGQPPTVTATYPQFSGGSVIRVVAFTNSTVVPPDQVSTNAGSNPTVNSGNVCLNGRHFLFGVVANGNVSTFTPDPGWIALGAPSSNSVGAGAGKRTLTTQYQVVDDCVPPCTDYALTGSLSGSGFWQAANVALAV
jgi:hypothetical protein